MAGDCWIFSHGIRMNGNDCQLPVRLPTCTHAQGVSAPSATRAPAHTYTPFQPGCYPRLPFGYSVVNEPSKCEAYMYGWDPFPSLIPRVIPLSCAVYPCRPESPSSQQATACLILPHQYAGPSRSLSACVWVSLAEVEKGQDCRPSFPESRVIS
jgi:hypothetical protein